MKQYTIEKLNIEPNAVVFIDTEKDFFKLKSLGLKLTSEYRGPYCYMPYDGTFCSNSTKTFVAEHRTKTEALPEIITPDQVLGFDEFVLPEKWRVQDCKEVSEWAAKIFNCGVPSTWEEGKQMLCINQITYPLNECYYFRDIEECSDYTEITFEQFKKYVLNKEVMEENKEIVGWKLKEECDQYKQAALTICNTTFNWENSLMPYDISIKQTGYITRLEKAGVLDLWFNPVYEEGLKPGDYVKWTGSSPTYGIIDKECDSGSLVSVNCYVLKNTIKEGVYNSCHFSHITKVTEEEYFNALIAEAEKRYPKGTRFIAPGATYVTISRGKASRWRNRTAIDNTKGMCLFYDNGKWAEVVKTPVIKVNGYKGEFYDTYVKFGCAEISKEVFIDLATIAEYANTNRSVESVTIGKGVFTKAQIQEIANYYQE